MTATLRKLAPTEVEIAIEVAPDELAAARERAFRKLVKRVRIPGFRPGHVPRRIFEQHVGADHIEHEAIDDLVPEVYENALREHNLEPVDRPKLDVEPLKPGEPLRVKATVAVRPEITLGAYKDVRIKQPPISVSDEEVENSLQALRRRVATLEPVIDRGMAAGDIVTLDYEGTIDGQPFPGGTADHHTTEISEGKFIPGFAEQLFDAKPGEQRTVHVTFPPTYQSKDLAGKGADFAVTIHEIKQPVLPDVDDDFAKLVSDNETVEALRADIRKRLELVAGQQARDSMEQELVSALLASHDFPLPEVLVEREVERMMADLQESVRSAGSSWEAYLRDRQLDEQSVHADMRRRAEQRVKSTLLVEAIAKAENVEVTTPAIEFEIARMANATKQTPERVLQMLREGQGLTRLVSAIRREKTIDMLLEKATAETEASKSGTVKGA